MARVNTIQTNFTSGEVSPKLYGRVDATKYFNGAAKLRNFIIAPQGGIYRRPGTKHVNPVVNSAHKTRLVRFQFSNQQAYVLEFGNLYFRVYKDGALVVTSPTAIVTPYPIADVARLRFVQSGDVVYVTHGSYAPRIISRTSHTAWTIAVYENLDGPYTGDPAEFKDVNLTVSSVSTTAIATASLPVFNSSPVFKAVASVAVVGVVARITSTAHGFTNGNIIIMEGLKVLVNGSYVLANHTQGNGFQTITGVTANTFDLADTSCAGAVFQSATGTAQNTSAARYVEYRDGKTWKLARVLSVQSTTSATVEVLPAILEDAGPTVGFTYATGTPATLTASNTGVFSQLDVGKYAKIVSTSFPPNSAGLANAWVIILSYARTDLVNVRLLTCYTYVYPTTIITVSDSTITGTVRASSASFLTTDVGRHIRLNFSGQQTWCKITSFISTTEVFVTFKEFVPTDLYDHTKIATDGITYQWRLGAWSDTSGWPQAACFHQQRLIFGRTTAEPQTFWMTESANYYSFAPSVLKDSAVIDSNAITATIYSNEVNPICWMRSGPVLLIGTAGAEFQVRPTNLNQALTPTNMAITTQTTFGSEDIDSALRVGSQTLFVQRGGRKIREMNYDFSLDAFVSKDVSILSEHIARNFGGIVETALQFNPFNILWLVTGDGHLVGITYEKDQEVVGWHVHELGGNGIVESAVCLPSTAGNSDYLYLQVRRTINGVSVRHIEFVEAFPTDYKVVTSHYFVDDGITFTQASALLNTISGTALYHLVGATVKMMVNGWCAGDRSVTASGLNGVMSVGYVCTTVHAGFSSTAILGTLELEGGSQAGSSQGKKKRVFQLIARLEDTVLQYKQGRAETELFQTEHPLLTTTTTVPVVTAVTGDERFSVDDSFDDGGKLFIVQDLPYPINIVALMPMTNVNE